MAKKQMHLYAPRDRVRVRKAAKAAARATAAYKKALAYTGHSRHWAHKIRRRIAKGALTRATKRLAAALAIANGNARGAHRVHHARTR